VAGYVDAVGFLMTGGFFVSFMSGNSTRLGVGLAEGSSTAVFAASLIATFVLGVVCGALVGRLATNRRRAAILALVSAFLMVGAGLGGLGFGRAAITPIVLAMGAENTVFAQDGEVRIGLTYMTGTLVRVGKRLAAALMGGERLGWAPPFFLWLGLLAGAIVGATVFRLIQAQALWGASGAMAILSFAASRMSDKSPDT
jgi:uncharacterized membrane protein YoaK (UPF0700 family)